MKIVKVKIADLAVLKENGVIMTVGLGSCVGVSLYDAVSRVGGLAHILLADSALFKNRYSVLNKAKFVDTAIPHLVQIMEQNGGRRSRLQVKIAGGSRLFTFQKAGISVGEKNVETARRILQQLDIPIAGEDVGGSHGRTMRLYVNSGRVVISAVGKGEREL